MTIKLGVVMDPIQSITVKKDTTLAMLLAAQKRGWEIHYMEQQDLYLDQDKAKARMRHLSVADDPQDWFNFGEQSDQALAELDVILMRKDPPFNMEYVYSTYLLEEAQQEGTLIVNEPRSLRDCNEKLYATQFPQCCPPFLVSCDAGKLKEFFREHEDVIYKPLDGMGGDSVFRVRKGDANLSVIIETLTDGGRTHIMAQQYIPAISEGDKRILLIDGEPIPWCLARVPARGESRGNLAAGGSGEVRELTDRDRWICEQVGENLRSRGLIFTGIDVIGDYLTEINVTSPTCVREIDRDRGIDIAGQLMDCIEARLSDSQGSSD